MSHISLDQKYIEEKVGPEERQSWAIRHIENGLHGESLFQY